MSMMDTALRESLKVLRLSEMLETLDARLAQARGGELGHLDFLQVLCQDEITRWETVAFQRRLHRAKFERQVTLEELDFTASSKLPAAQIRDLAALRWLHAGESVILFGPTVIPGLVSVSGGHSSSGRFCDRWSVRMGSSSGLDDPTATGTQQ
ncbi:ATP-binding protein [Streptomyces sp. NPDC060064]|uniref:ATP-binding protein n=1 Tax=Streptomyces sp. NPDC060064 TaxID=3347049 RepID=UPI0036BCC3D0